MVLLLWASNPTNLIASLAGDDDDYDHRLSTLGPTGSSGVQSFQLSEHRQSGQQLTSVASSSMHINDAPWGWSKHKPITHNTFMCYLGDCTDITCDAGGGWSPTHTFANLLHYIYVKQSQCLSFAFIPIHVCIHVCWCGFETATTTTEGSTDSDSCCTHPCGVKVMVQKKSPQFFFPHFVRGAACQLSFVFFSVWWWCAKKGPPVFSKKHMGVVVVWWWHMVQLVSWVSCLMCN